MKLARIHCTKKKTLIRIAIKPLLAVVPAFSVVSRGNLDVIVNRDDIVESSPNFAINTTPWKLPECWRIKGPPAMLRKVLPKDLPTAVRNSFFALNDDSANLLFVIVLLTEDEIERSDCETAIGLGVCDLRRRPFERRLPQLQ